MIRFSLLLLSLFCSVFLFAQRDSLNDSGVDAIYTSNESNVIKTTKMKAFINTIKASSDKKTLSKAHHKLGLLYHRNNNFKEAITSTKKAIKLRNSEDSIDYYKLNNSLYNLSFYYERIRDVEKRKEVLYELVNKSGKNKFTYKGYIDLAYTVSVNGDYFRALDYLKEAISAYDVTYDDVSTLLSAHKAAIYMYSEIDETKLNLENVTYHEKKIDTLILSYGFTKGPSVSNNLGNIYEGLNLNQKAIDNYFKALKIYKENKDSINVGVLYNNIGRVYSKLKDTLQAKIYAEKVLQTTNSEEAIAAVYTNSGFYLEKDKIYFYNKAINTLLHTNYENELPTFNEVQQSNHKLDVLDNLIHILNVRATNYLVKKEAKELKKATKLCVLIDKLLSSIRLESKVEKSKLLWIRKASSFYMCAVKVCYFKNDVAQAFYFMEKNKSLLLLENLKKKDTTVINSLTITSLKEATKKHVTSKRNMLAYILNNEEGYGVFCNEKEKILFKLSNVPKLIEELGTLKRKMTQYFIGTKDKESYNSIAYSVFEKVFPFKNSKQKIKGKQLIVIPDYTLQYINFEALISDKLTQRFVFEDTEISYFLSASVTQQLAQRTVANLHEKILGLAPVHFKINGLLPLNRSEKAMQEIAAIYPAEIFVNEHATQKSFCQNMRDYDIIHINSHAGITKNTLEPWLAFHDQKIGLKELSALPNNAKLVVLDACKGASGKQEVGEGIMSLARGFFRGGSASVVTNQWNANEKATNEILVDFYKELKKGKTKSKALHIAKKKYLQNHQLSELSPYYWASLILIGDYNTIENRNNSNYIWVFFLWCLLVIVFGARKKIIKTKSY